MKIDATTAQTLIERMQAASESPAASPVAATTAPGAAEITQSSLATSLRTTAQRVLAGELQDIESVRAEIIDDLLRERWQDKVPAAELNTMVAELAPSLLNDPQFSRQIDEMLVLAAREVGVKR